ncbi:MAG: ATP-binding cassette domain-containing protein [Planctomycetales bacterium]|nr:ATP-binding cassette domain-containing protein [Planctomycetales bacterium]
MSNEKPLLSVRDLKVHFPVRSPGLFGGSRQVVKAVDGVDLDVARGETIGLVGESGCGKSTIGQAILQLIRPTSGTVQFDGIELTSLWSRRFGRDSWSPTLLDLRRRMQMIFQDPYACLNPRMTVESIVGEPLRNFKSSGENGYERRRRVQELLTRVGMNPRYIRRYPHEFSGGQRQRIGIARALALNPDLIIADEPISALDVSIQSQILNLMQDLQAEFNLTYIFIAHDLAAVRHVSDRIAVMYLGRIVELATADDIYQSPQHPYSKALISSVPIPDPKIERKRERIVLEGDVPSPIDPPRGCPFHTRCPFKEDRCAVEAPTLKQIGDNDHQAACHLL